MISVSKAKGIINHEEFEPAIKKISLPEAVNAVLAEPVVAVQDVPAFEQSSMDGYAFKFQDLESGRELKITAEIPAGKREKTSLLAGQAARIFTGAPLPDGADTVVMQELTAAKDGIVTIRDSQLKPGDNTRRKGAEIQGGERAMEKGTVLSPGAIGFLAGIGIGEVMVCSNPSVGIIITGDELQHPGDVLLPGQVYECSSSMLQAALHQMDIRDIGIWRASDSLQGLTIPLKTALESHEVILICGGVSVGDYDFVGLATRECGVTPLFHGVNQRPGKPLFFGRMDHKPVFGLPGNPASGLTCFYEYVWPLLRRLSGKPAELTTMKARLSQDYTKNSGLTHFLKGHYHGGEVEPLRGQESFRLRSFAVANCLIQLEEEVITKRKGDWVEIHLLPLYG